MKKESKNKDLKQGLVAVGLNDKEAEVYLALIALGKGTVSRIMLRAGLNRTTGYDILNSLVAKGLASISGKEPKQEYAAEPPEFFKTFAATQAEEARARATTAEALVSELATLYHVEGRPRIRFYEGRDGLKTVYEDTLTAHEPILAYANVDDMHRALPNYFPDYYRRRAKKKIAIHAIIPKTEIGVERASHDMEEMRETALVPPDAYNFSPEINVYDNKVMIASWREKLGIIIESAEIADAMKTIYKLAWAEAKRLARESGSSLAR